MAQGRETFSRSKKSTTSSLLLRDRRPHGSSGSDGIFSPAFFAKAAPACLAGSHSRWLVDSPVLPDSPTFLRSRCYLPIVGLPRCYRGPDSCVASSSEPTFPQPGRRLYPLASLSHASDLLILLSLRTTRRPSGCEKIQNRPRSEGRGSAKPRRAGLVRATARQEARPPDFADQACWAKLNGATDRLFSCQIPWPTWAFKAC